MNAMVVNDCAERAIQLMQDYKDMCMDTADQDCLALVIDLYKSKFELIQVCEQKCLVRAINIETPQTAVLSTSRAKRRRESGINVFFLMLAQKKYYH